MADQMLTIDVDAASLLRALNTLGPEAAKHLKAAAKETAEAIATEARSRARRFRKTGYTEEGISVEELHSGDGYVVWPWKRGRPIHQNAKGQPAKNVPIWLEFGTKYASKQPYFFVAAEMEKGPHMRRVAIALTDAIDEVNR